MADIKQGGQVERLNGVITEINFHNPEDNSAVIPLWIKSNHPDYDESLSYLTIEECEELVSEIKESIKIAKKNLKRLNK